MRVDYKKIETTEQLLNWANEANFCMNDLEYKCKLQDVFEHSEVDILKQLFLEQSKNFTNLRLILFSIWKTNGDEYWWTFSRYLHVKIINEQLELDYKSVAYRASKLWDEKKKFEDYKKFIYKRITEQKKKMEYLERKINYLKLDLDTAQTCRRMSITELKQYKENSHKYQQLINLIGGKI